MKKCNKCGKIKPLDNFWKSKNTKDGLRSACKSCLAEEGRQYRKTENGREAIKRTGKKCSETHRKKITERAKKWYRENKEKAKVRIKEYTKTPKGRLIKIKSNHKRRAQKKAVLYEIFDPQEVFERDGWRCQHCHKKVQWLNKSPNHPLYPNLDHIVPLSKGGEHTRRNTQLLCRECNSKKHTNDVGEQLRLF